MCKRSTTTLVSRRVGRVAGDADHGRAFAEHEQLGMADFVIATLRDYDSEWHKGALLDSLLEIVMGHWYLF
jgi:hypothetical protein